MPHFASLSVSAEGIGIIISAVFIGLVQMLTLILQYLRDRDQIRRQTEVARRVEDVRVKAEQTHEQTYHSAEDLKAMTVEQNKVLDTVVAKVEQVHLATNGLKDELVEEVKKASFAQGVKSEKEKHPPEKEN